MLIRRLRNTINELWARHQVFRVVLVISFLVSITAISIYIAYTLYQIGLFHFFSVVFIPLLLGVQRGIFKKIAETLKKRTYVSFCMIRYYQGV